MRKCSRATTPAVLVEHGPRWTANYIDRWQEKGGSAFYWPEHDRKHLNHHLEPPLRSMTDGRCAFCDGGVLGAAATFTIEHLWSKSHFPCLAYEWENLFPCCNACQAAKLADPIDDPLRPDHEEFSCARYFVWNIVSGEIEANRAATAEDQIRANAMIGAYDLNRPALVNQRLAEQRHFIKAGAPRDDSDWNYRDFLEAGQA